jgi:putative N6-adenine-specific DNA methylase
MLNPPYGERIEVGGVAGPGRFGARESAQTSASDSSERGEGGGGGDGGEFFPQLATHWKKNYAGWTAWVLTPDLKLPKQMRLKESRRVPMWNGPIECRLFRFDMVAGSARKPVAS